MSKPRIKLKCYVCPYCCGKEYKPLKESNHKCIGRRRLRRATEMPKHEIGIPLETIISNLALCICCNEPDSEKYRAETEYWLEKLVREICPKEKVSAQKTHTVKVETNSAGYIWVCSCGKVWPYSYANLDGVNRHTGVTR